MTSPRARYKVCEKDNVINYKLSDDVNLSDHGHAKSEEEKTECGGELASLENRKSYEKSSLSDELHLGPQLLGPHVDDAGDEGLDDTELGVDADGDQHEEEHHRPDRPSWQLQHHLGELVS